MKAAGTKVEAKRLAASGAFDFLLADNRPLLKTTAGKALGMNDDSVRSLIEEGRLESHSWNVTGTRPSYRVTRRSVLLYLAETAELDPGEFPRRVNSLLKFMNPAQLADTAAELAKLQKP